MVVPAAELVLEPPEVDDEAVEPVSLLTPLEELDDPVALDVLEELEELDELDEPVDPDPVEELLPQALTIRAMAETTATAPIGRRCDRGRRSPAVGLVGWFGLWTDTDALLSGEWAVLDL